jgi:AcrR family transcriptional regulator
MTPRNEQDFEQRRQQIIDGAFRVFAAQGFDKATNRDIATAAGIGSPGLIYHYFVDKEDLFRQVIEQRAPLDPLVEQIEYLMELPPREALSLFGRTFLRVAEQPEYIAFYTMALGNSERYPFMLERINHIGPGRWIPVLSRYMERQMDAGALRRVPIAAAVRCFVGGMLASILVRAIIPQPDTATLSRDEMVTTAVEVFLHGLAHEPDEEAGRITSMRNGDKRNRVP